MTYVAERLEGHKPGDYAVFDLIDRLGPARDVPPMKRHRFGMMAVCAFTLLLNLAAIAAVAIWRGRG